MQYRFKDRREAGMMLAEKLRSYAGRADAIVLALPRGGVPVAYEVAAELDLPMDVFVVRKIGAPGHREFALGSIASGGMTLIDRTSVRALGVPEAVLGQIIDDERTELARREKLYRGNGRPLDLVGKTVIIVDDGLATGLTMRAAVAAIRKHAPKEIVVAVPVCAPLSCDELEQETDTWCICVQSPEPFYAVGLWYDNFEQTTDEEVRELLKRASIAKAKGHFV